MNRAEVQHLIDNKEEFNKVAKEGYDSVDVNQNGVIDLIEVETILKDFAKKASLPPPSKKEINDTYNILDKNKNGKIDFEEFKVFFKNYLLKF